MEKAHTELERSREPPPCSQHEKNGAVHPLLRLQGTVGNQAVTRMLTENVVQAKRVTQPAESSEIEADRIAEQITSSPAAGAAQAQGSRSESSPSTSRQAGSGKPLDDSSRQFFEPRLGRDLSDVRVHTGSNASRMAESLGARAFTTGNDIAFGEGQYEPSAATGRKLLAHELVHVVQQSTNAIEQGTIQRACDSPKDKAEVEKAKKRLAVLEPELAALENRRIEIEADRLRTLDARNELDKTSEDASIPFKQQTEALNLQKLNRKPVNIMVTSDAIVFQVKFQVLFNDPKMSSRFGDLKKTIQAGIDLVWNQKIQSGAFAGRKFTIVPEVTLIDALAKRTDDAWLIEVRQKDAGPVQHGGCTLEQPGPGAPTSVTEPLCDDGLMSIPPAHITNPGVLGHEIMHLFGLVDRYVAFTDIPKKGKPITTLQPTRETRGRKDPLGGQDATILSEDLGYIFSGFGVYEQEKDRRSPGLAIIEREVRRLREIVETGCAPDSLIRIREDFRDKIIKSVDEL